MKKFINYFIVFIFVGVCFSCNPIPNQSVIEPLSEKQWKDISKKDSLFGELYPMIRQTVLNLKTAELRAEYKDLTYRDLMKFYKYVTDYNNKSNDDYKNDCIKWESIYGKYAEKADSTINYWEQELDSNDEILLELQYYFNHYVSVQRIPTPIELANTFKYTNAMPECVKKYLANKYGVYKTYTLTDDKAEIAELFSSIGYESKLDYLFNQLQNHVLEKFPQEIRFMEQY